MKLKFFMGEQLTSALKIFNPDIKSEVFSALDDICSDLFPSFFMRTILPNHLAVLIKITAYTDEEVNERTLDRVSHEIRDRMWLALCALGNEQSEIVNDFRDQVKVGWGLWAGLTS